MGHGCCIGYETFSGYIGNDITIRVAVSAIPPNLSTSSQDNYWLRSTVVSVENVFDGTFGVGLRGFIGKLRTQTHFAPLAYNQTCIGYM